MRTAERSATGLAAGSWAIAFLGSFAAFTAAAQEATDPLDEVVVVAERRETLLQKTPVTVTAFTAENLEANGVQDLRDIAAATPGMYLGGYAMLGNFPISIRGIGSSVGGIGADDPVSVYADGVYVGRPSGFIFQFVDVERLEVLRGPQGTLYGRNATGGAINVVSSAPSDRFTAHGSLQYGRFDEMRAELGISAPLGDKAGFRFGGIYRDIDGFQTNLLDGRDVNGESDAAFRASLWLQPTERIAIKLHADAASDEDPSAFKDVGAGIGDPDETNINEDTRSRRKPAGGSATVSFDLGAVTLTSITGYRRSKADVLSDSDLLPVSVTPLAWIEEQDQFTQELQAISGDDGALRWTLGAYFLREDADLTMGVDIVPLASSIVFDDSIDVTSYAGYGQATYALTQSLNVTGGLRYSSEEKEFTFGQFGTGIFPPVLVAPTRSRESWNAWTPKLGLDFDVAENAMLYISASRGFKSGGFNFTSTQSPFDPEYVWAYEAGLKSEWLSRRVRLNLAGFVYDYTDLQVRVPATITSVSIENAASADVRGIEAEFIARLTNAFQVEGSVAYLDATYKEFFIPDSFDPITGEPIRDPQGNIILRDLSGNRLNRSPEWQLNAAAQYVMPVGSDWSATLRASYQHQDGVYFTQDNDAVFANDGWDNVDLRVIFEQLDGLWGVSLFLDNATDERYISNVVDVNPGAGGFVNLPRRWGLRVSYKY